VACNVLIFHDDEGNEQMRMCFVETSPPVHLVSGDLKAAGSVGIGDVVRLPDRTWRRVDAVECD
jgi:hypothetical protein